MEVVIPKGDFDFTKSSSSYMSAPSTPKRFGEFFYFSAPSSPTHSSDIYKEFNTLSIDNSTTEKNLRSDEKTSSDFKEEDEDYDFEFNFGGQLEKPDLIAAEELFEKGKIRPLNQKEALPKSPRSKMFGGAFSPRGKKDQDLFESEENRENRGRERRSNSNISSSSRRSARSLSPYRVSDFSWEEKQQEQEQEHQQQITNASLPNNSSNSKPLISSSSSGNSKKWRLKDLLLFRSASEGSSTAKDPLRKYRVMNKKTEDLKNSSFRSIDGNSGSNRGRKGPVSAHELHYTANRAASEGMRKKTFLPYRQGLLGFLGFNPTVPVHAKGFRV
ncbi:uncharacterized protein LOC143890690 [Tasmannia lanceolata]|uniref:uncharacterized protein LOC143890690 n=1 Tax=Tasmannia lanceolata TaxID=3420 RepID=UPI0040643AA8